MTRFALLLFVGLIPSSLSAADRPNVLIIMADDCTYNDLPMYGGKNAMTPNLEHLASQGLTFNRAYLAEAMCQPCRAELYSGLYPMRNGCAWNHSSSLPETQSMPHYLAAIGYRVGLAGKVHVQPATAFPFEQVPGFDPSCVRDPTRDHDLTGVKEFMTRDSQSPFVLVVALVEPHVPWVMGDASAYPPSEIELPENVADTALTREAFGRYLAEITYMDGQVGELLDLLQGAGLNDDTLVLFTSEQGSQFPGNKWTNWDTGVHTALMARWPNHIAPGMGTDALVQYADVVPTLLDACGADIEANEFDGSSFLPVLLGEKDSHREFVFGMHNNVPEGPAYPIRSVTDGEFHYIQNLTPNEMYIEKHLMGIKGDGALNNPYWATWIWNSTEDPATYNLVHRYMHRPAEQLYQLEQDPYEMNNLASKAEFSERKSRLATQLANWMKIQGDPGIPQDTFESLRAAKRGKHRFYPPNE